MFTFICTNETILQSGSIHFFAIICVAFVEDRVLCERTKRTLLDTQWDDMNDYADAKTKVILAIKARARAACRR
ncbi:hypothetical protein KKR91_07835 [Arthrobacter jiangjiafuii]|uniref:Uncharacterized protein n=1 Tax=Arthrobacter jiangjiafuii TaxID=2817475 RepID=A0A975M7Z2_9MICC|nr:hypothetical protein [Arthrobacter jiangjiafuii]MBP3042914.1 hypothetical protein [Arthrobacter jiangjiafuii]QWC11445.1 hypothetical protein KKR91_07835 [Arthrobacter jiangjiafuii]